MASLNRVLLIGNLTKAPELRYTPSGQAVADLRVAVNRSYQSRDGQRRDSVDYFTVVTWAKTAESCAQYLEKGSPIFVEGRLQTRDWETKDGQKRNVVEVVAERVEFLPRAKPTGSAPEGPSPEGRSVEEPVGEVDDVPF